MPIKFCITITAQNIIFCLFQPCFTTTARTRLNDAFAHVDIPFMSHSDFGSSSLFPLLFYRQRLARFYVRAVHFYARLYCHFYRSFVNLWRLWYQIVSGYFALVVYYQRARRVTPRKAEECRFKVCFASLNHERQQAGFYCFDVIFNRLSALR